MARVVKREAGQAAMQTQTEDDLLTMTTEDEAELGSFLQRCPVLPQHTFDELHRRWQAGDQHALVPIYNSNKRLVRWVARRLHNRYPHLSYDELCEEGDVLLLGVLERYDNQRGNKFSTFAVSNLEFRMIRKMREDCRGAYRLPIYMQHRLEFIDHSRATYLAHYRVEPNDTQLIKWMLKSKKGGKEGRLAATHKMLKLAREIQRGQCASLDKPMGDGRGGTQDATLMDICPDQDYQSGETARLAKQLLVEYEAAIGRIDMALENLGLKKLLIDVLHYRLGWGVKRSMTLKELGEHFGLSRERIRQHEATALRRLCAAYEVNPSQLQGLLAGAAALRELVGDAHHGKGLNVDATFSLGPFPELANRPHLFIPSLRQLGTPREVYVEPPRLILRGDAVWTVLETVAEHYRMTVQSILYPQGFGFRHRWALRVAIHLLEYSLGWTPKTIGRVLQRNERIVESCLNKLETARQTDPHLAATVRAFEKALMQLRPKAAPTVIVQAPTQVQPTVVEKAVSKAA